MGEYGFWTVRCQMCGFDCDLVEANEDDATCYADMLGDMPCDQCGAEGAFEPEGYGAL
jgi:hypothetical protein